MAQVERENFIAYYDRQSPGPFLSPSERFAIVDGHYVTSFRNRLCTSRDDVEFRRWGMVRVPNSIWYRPAGHYCIVCMHVCCIKELPCYQRGPWLVMLPPSSEKCESPIEVMLDLALRRVGLIFTNQLILLKYRVDFAFEAQKLIVECDGHDFHERTKEQATRDKRRDRDLLKLGWRTIRFTGSEIFKDPDACAKEVAEMLT
jgi:very-short-patch-repair endonuclease